MLNGVLQLCMPKYAVDGFAASARSRLPPTLPAMMQIRLRGFAKPLKTPDASFREYAASLAFFDHTTAEETAWFRLDSHRLADMRARAKQLLELTRAHFAIAQHQSDAVRELLKTRITALLAQPSPMTGVPAWLPPLFVNKARDMHAAWARVVRVAWSAHGQRIAHILRSS